MPIKYSRTLRRIWRVQIIGMGIVAKKTSVKMLNAASDRIVSFKGLSKYVKMEEILQVFTSPNVTKRCMG